MKRENIIFRFGIFGVIALLLCAPTLLCAQDEGQTTSTAVNQNTQPEPKLVDIPDPIGEGTDAPTFAGWDEMPRAQLMADTTSRELRTYPLGENDEIEVVFFQSADFEDNGRRINMYVNGDGTIFVPLLGRVVAAGRSAKEMEVIIQEGLSEWIRTPVVMVRVLQYRSHTVSLLGQFMSQGVYPLPREAMLSEFIAKNGGIQPSADESKITIMRLSGDQVIVNLKSFYELGDVSQDIVLMNRDRVFIPKRPERLIDDIAKIVSVAVLILQVATLALLLAD